LLPADHIQYTHFLLKNGKLTMKILLLAPHPFYQERGTPIAVRLLVQALAEQGHAIDILTYHEGSDVDIAPSVRIVRIPAPPLARNIRPGFSIKKILCDFAMHPRAMHMARENRYDLVHAIEESVFMAMAIKRRCGIPYVYDMDSSLPQQMAEKQPLFRLVSPILRSFERRAIRGSACVVPMCDALAELAEREGARKVFVLRDIPLADAISDATPVTLPELKGRGVRFMYIGNLEPYQGIDLLLDSFCRLHDRQPNVNLTIVGGRASDVARYTAKAQSRGAADAIQFTGPQPVAAMNALFDRADVLVSPRTKGVNTPMKIYSYLMSGKPVLATDIPSHAQVLHPDTALLAAANVDEFSEAMHRLACDAGLRSEIGTRGRELAAREYSFAAFREKVKAIYGWLAVG